MTRSVCVQILLTLESLRVWLAGPYNAPWGGQDPSSGPSKALGERASISAVSMYIFILTSFFEIFTHHTIHLFKVYNSVFFSTFTELYSHHF